MFAIGETKSRVCFSKLRLPKEYRLKKKGRKIYGVWEGNRRLYLSDEMEVLRSKSGKNILFEPKIDYNGRLDVPLELDNKEATIRGCITTIVIEFER